MCVCVEPINRCRVSDDAETRLREIKGSVCVCVYYSALFALYNVTSYFKNFRSSESHKCTQNVRVFDKLVWLHNRKFRVFFSQNIYLAPLFKKKSQIIHSFICLFIDLLICLLVCQFILSTVALIRQFKQIFLTNKGSPF